MVWVRRGDRITLFALNFAMGGPADAPKRELLGRRSLQAPGLVSSLYGRVAASVRSRDWRAGLRKGKLFL